MEDGAKTRNLVIKVKYGDSLRRFCACVTGNTIDHDMSILKSKIISLFKFSPDVDLVLRYTDVDGDLVTLENDGELSDAVINQSLNPLRIFVQLNRTLQTRSESSHSNPLSRASPELSTLQSQINSTVKEALKSVPEPVQDALSNLSQDILSKAAASAPIFSDIAECFSKLGLSNRYLSQASSSATSSSTGVASSHQSDLNIGNTSSRPVARADLLLDVKLAAKGKPVDSMPKNLEHLETIKTSPRLETLGTVDTDSIPLRSSVDDGLLETPPKDANPNSLPNASLPTPAVGQESMNVPPPCRLHCNVISTSMERSNGEQSPAVMDLGDSKNILVNTQAVGPSTSTVAPDGTPSPFMSFQPRHYMHHTPPLHLNVVCHGCGMRPIVGPLYKSNVRNDYDLCSFCFSQIGNGKDYVCIDQSAFPYSPLRSFTGCYSNPHAFRGPHGKSFKAKLESRFVQDVTIMDGTLVAPFNSFTKIWRMQNNGVTSWPRGTQLIWIGGDQLANRSSVELVVHGNCIPVNSEVDISVDCIAPSMPGQYTSYWRLATPSGHKFGQRVWVDIQVEPSAPAYGYQPKIDLNAFPQNEQGLPWMVGAPIESNGENLINFPDRDDFSGGSTKHAVGTTHNDRSAETTLSDNISLPSNKLPEVTAAVTEAAPTSIYLTVSTESTGSTPEITTLIGLYPAVDPSVAPLASQIVPVPPLFETGHLPLAPKSVLRHPFSAPESIPLLPLPVPERVSMPSLAAVKTRSASPTYPDNNIGRTDLVPPVSPKRIPVPFFSSEPVSMPFLAAVKTRSTSPTDPDNNLGATDLVSPASPKRIPVPFVLPEVIVSVPPLPAPNTASMHLPPTSRTAPLSSYPSIDLVPAISPLPPSASAPPSESTHDNDLELLLLRELDGMGFTDVEMNKEMLRKNEYDLEETIDDLCGVSELDPLLNELRDMGFRDEELNKKLLIKNDGSIKLVVLDLISGETK